MSTQAFDGAYRRPFFRMIEQVRGEGAYRQLPALHPASSLAVDDALLGPYAITYLVCNSYAAGLAHADALRRLTVAGEVDPISPWTLLRGALENFATGLWLIDGIGRDECRHRVLFLWDEDMRNRHQHEQDTGHQPSGTGKTGAPRRTPWCAGRRSRRGAALSRHGYFPSTSWRRAMTITPTPMATPRAGWWKATYVVSAPMPSRTSMRVLIWSIVFSRRSAAPADQRRWRRRGANES
ncbi:hypothetical protein [Streptomyces sp. LN245]|uniref:hypothetical protein n=1 Tax=Streptomyces sp. LN245 TaxID=3112975 RepID=UPI0037152C39